MPKAAIYGMVALSALFWGANFNLAAPVLADLAAPWAAAGRFLIAAAVMALVLAVRRQGFGRIGLRGIGAYALLGLVGVGGFNLMFFWAMGLTSAVNAALIMSTNPLVTAVLARLFLGERLSGQQAMALPVALLGVAAVISGGDPSRLLALELSPGDGLMMMGNLCWAAYSLLGKRLLPVAGALPDTAGIMAAGAVVLTIGALGQHSPLTLPGPLAATALVAMAVGGSVLAYLFWNAGVKALGAGRTALFLNLVPVCTMLIGGLTGHPPTMLQALGGSLVIAAVAWAMMPLPRLRRAAA